MQTAKATVLVGLLAMLCLSGTATADPIVIAGSSGVTPPPFMENSFWGITAFTDFAVRFTVPAGGPFLVQQAQGVMWHYASMSGEGATFSIHADASGAPGAALTTFEFAGISTSPAVMSAPAQSAATLQSGSSYWLVASTTDAQVNLNYGTGPRGVAAERTNEGPWTVYNNFNQMAYAIIGMPEPSVLALLAIGCLILAAPRRR